MCFSSTNVSLVKQNFKLQHSCMELGKNVNSFLYIYHHVIVGMNHGQSWQPLLTNLCFHELVKYLLSVLADHSYSHEVPAKVHASFSSCKMLGNCWPLHSFIALAHELAGLVLACSPISTPIVSLSDLPVQVTAGHRCIFPLFWRCPRLDCKELMGEQWNLPFMATVFKGHLVFMTEIPCTNYFVQKSHCVEQPAAKRDQRLTNFARTESFTWIIRLQWRCTLLYMHTVVP